MLRFDCNISTMYRDQPLLDAFAAARRDGFDAVECWLPYSEPAERVRETLASLGLTLVQFNFPMGDFAGGERGIGGLPGREAEFRADVDRVLAYAETLGVKQVNCLGGLVPAGVDRKVAEDVFVANLAYAAPRLADAGIRLQIEPLNKMDNPGALVESPAMFQRLAARVDHDNVHLQLDFYHQQVSGGDLLRTFDRYRERISHVQIADNPGRHEPGTGEINYRFLLAALADRGYSGWVGLEYIPRTNVRDGLGWLGEVGGQPR